MLEGMAMVFAAVVFRHEPTIRRAMPFQSIPSIGHRIRATIGENLDRHVVGVVECVEHDTDKIDSLDTCPITLYCVQITEADSDVQNS